MRKFLVGCSVVLFASLIFWSIVFYRGCYRPMQESRTDLMLIGSLHSYDEQITNKTPYSPPDDDRLSPDQLRLFLAVQREMRSAADTSYTKVRDRMAAFDSTMLKHPEKFAFGFGGMMGTFKGIGPDMVHLKLAQVAALNHYGLSWEEYRWIRGSILRALGRGGAGSFEMDFDATKKPGARARVESRPPMSEPRVPAENIALVKTVADSLDDWVPLSVVGL